MCVDLSIALCFSTEVGSGLGLIASLTCLIRRWEEQPNLPPPYVPRRKRGWQPFTKYAQELLHINEWGRVKEGIMAIANAPVACL
jgi:hypothetical protein